MPAFTIFPIASRLGAAVALATAASVAIAQGIVGTFEARLVHFPNDSTFRLQCVSDESCVFAFLSQSAGHPPASEIKKFKVRPLEEFRHVNAALDYALERKDKQFLQQENVEIMKQLRPILDAEPVIEKCWDLDHSNPEYLVSCYVRQKNSRRHTLLLFGTYMANCGELFCRFMLFPMHKVR